MSGEDLIRLEEYNRRYRERLEEERKPKKVFTKIKCEKCEGRYRYVDLYMEYASNPPQKAVICDLCGDERNIWV